MIQAIITWLLSHKRIAVEALLSLCTALSILYGITIHKQNQKLTESLEIAQNNIEAYQGLLDNSQQACNVLQLDMSKLKESNDKLIQQIDSVRKENKISSKGLTTAATQTQVLNVNSSKGVGGQVIVIKDTIYTDSIKYNDLTNVYYSIGKDSISIRLDVRNTQYLYIYKKKEYKNKKNFFKRLFTLDFKKITKYKYKIVNTNELLKGEDIRIIEQQ